MKQRPISMGTDTEHGTTIVRVPLGPDAKHHCELEIADWQALLMAGYSGNLNYVRPKDSTKIYPIVPSKAKNIHQIVARVILKADKGTRVFYRDGNPCNLRRSNLQIKKKNTE